MIPSENCSLPVAFAQPSEFVRLRDLLGRTEFNERGVLEALGIDGRAISADDLALLLRRTGRATPLETLIRLFLIGVSVDERDVRRAIEPIRLEEWLFAGLVRQEHGAVAAQIQLLPHQGLWLAYDLPARASAGPKPDYVMGVGGSSLTLANGTIRRRARWTLDLGTGCGFQAFLAARHSDRVVAVDRNPRSVRMAEFNARLNDLPNVECLEGDFFAPVREHTFDLIVSNPPFVISPESQYIYRDSGLRDDEVTRQIIREVPPRLVEGGFCQILCNWAHVAGQDWKDRLAAWFEGTGCDGWVLRCETMAADAYAAKWIRHTERDNPDEFARRFSRWVAYYEAEGIEAVSGGLITLRRRAASSHWFRADDTPDKMLGVAGESIAAGFAMQDFLEATQRDEVFLAQRFRVSPDARLLHRLAPATEGWRLEASELRLARGLAYTGAADPYVAQLLARCNGEHALGELVQGIAADLGVDPQQTVAACLDVVRRLVKLGFLLPAAP
jgi:SAM-dependent methyltransferase